LGWTKTSLVPHVEAVRLAKLHDVTASLAIGYKMGRKLLPPAMAAFLHYRFMEIDPTAAELFFMDLVSGEGLQKNRPVYQLRERLMANRLAKAKLPQREIMAITIKAFKMERQGKKIEHLRWRNQGAQAEPFPQFEDDL
jgi:hypothetical protein